MEIYISCLLGEAFGSQETSLSHSMPIPNLDGRDQAAARDLYAETARLFPAAPRPRIVRGVELQTVSVLHISHHLAWPNHPDEGRLVLTREVVQGPEQGAVPIELSISELSRSAQNAVGSLDRFAISTSRRLIDEAIQRLSGQSTPDPAPAQPWRIFVSYRRTDRDLARRVYDALGAYGGGAFFRPYLDDHDLRAGDLERRLEEGIDQSDIVVAIATRSYAPPESWSRREVDMARASRVPLIPLVFGSERPESWPGWKDNVAHEFDDRDELGAGSKAFGKLAALCLRTVEGGMPAGAIADGVVEAVEKGLISVQLRIDDVGLSRAEFRKGEMARVWLRASASPFPITTVTVCYGRTGIGAFRVCPNMVLTSGTAESGEWTGSFVLRADWPAGEWVLQGATIQNRFGYGSSVDPGDWARQGGGGSRFVVQ